MASTGEAGRLGRRPALDGLRGIAAVVVMLSHILFADTWLADHHATPLKVAGSGAVMVFFVLSGYVLARPFLQGRGKAWRVYYPARLLRLYVPVWAALVFALLLSYVIPRETGTGNWWLDYSVGPWTASQFAVYASLWQHGSLLNQLWSLKWEVAFSLFLPLYVAAARLLARSPVIGFVSLAAINLAAHAASVKPVQFLSVFAFGALIAAVEPARGWSVPGTSWLATRPVLWLGRVSFSLYLVHLPVLLALARLHAPLVVALPLAVATSLIVAAAFYAVVEAPSQRWSAALAKGQPIFTKVMAVRDRSSERAVVAATLSTNSR